jgi:methionyl-tRNA formyltransferase
MRLIFAGTPEFAARALAALIRAGHDIPLVLTQPDRPAGRGMKLTPSPVKRLVLERGLQVLQPENLKGADTQALLAGFSADVMVVAAYGLLLPKAVLEIPKFGCLNIHASLLPRWRGAAPIQRSILAGDVATGITIMQMDAGLDTGAMLLKKTLPITLDDTAGSLHDRLAAQGASAIVEALELMGLGQLKPEPQDEAVACYAAKITKAEAKLDWTDSAGNVARAVRAFNPAPGAFSLLHGDTIKIWRAQAEPADAGESGEIIATGTDGIVVRCGEGALRIHELQKAGGKRLSAAQFLAGNALTVGQKIDH